MRRGFAVAWAALAIAAAAASAGAATVDESLAWRAAGEARLADVPIGGTLVAALAAEPGGPIDLLVRPDDEVDGPRRLLRVERQETPRRGTIAENLEGWGKALAALAGPSGDELVMGGLGRLASFGALSTPSREPRDLLLHPGFDLRSLAPSRLRVGVEPELAAAEVGALRVWRRNDAGDLAFAVELPLPISVERRPAGLRLEGVRVTGLASTADGRRRFAVGPQAATASRLRVLLVEEQTTGEWETTECWVALPAPEEVEESWIADGDDGAWLIVRSQGAVEINAFEDQLWRLYRLAPDRTRAGRRPTLAFRADSKRWHDNEAMLADADGDGHRDLLIARPEGLTGSDLVVERFSGLGGGRFDSRRRRTDLDKAPSEARWVADLDGRGTAGMLTITGDELVAWKVAGEGRRAIERDPWLRAPLPRGEDDARVALDLLGTAPRVDGPPDVLVLARPKQGESRLLIVRPPRR